MEVLVSEISEPKSYTALHGIYIILVNENMAMEYSKVTPFKIYHILQNTFFKIVKIVKNLELCWFKDNGEISPENNESDLRFYAT